MDTRKPARPPPSQQPSSQPNRSQPFFTRWVCSKRRITQNCTSLTRNTVEMEFVCVRVWQNSRTSFRSLQCLQQELYSYRKAVFLCNVQSPSAALVRMVLKLSSRSWVVQTPSFRVPLRPWTRVHSKFHIFSSLRRTSTESIKSRKSVTGAADSDDVNDDEC